MQSSKKDLLNRLATIEGHIKGIRKMVEEDQYCVDILKQTYAVHRAIDKLESLLLHGHLKSCVVQGIHEGREEEVLGELGDLYDLAQR